MGFSQSRDGSGVTVVKVEGQLIVGNRQELKDLVFAALDKGERRILIDFSQTGYIDSSGLGALVSISKRVREAGGELRLSGLNEDLRSLFELTKLDTLFAIAETPQQALSSLYRRHDVAPSSLRPPLAGPGRGRRRDARHPAAAQRHRLRGGGRRAGGAPLPGRPRHHPHDPLSAPGLSQRGAQQRDPAGQPGRAGQVGGGPARALHRRDPGVRDGRGHRLRSRQRAGADPSAAARRARRARPLPHPQAGGRGALQFAGELHLHDAPPSLGRLDLVLDRLGALIGGSVLLWRFDGRGLRIAGGGAPGWTPPIPRSPGLVPTPGGSAWLTPVEEVEGFWLSVQGAGEARMRSGADQVLPVVEAMLDAERQRAYIAEELTSRYEEIDL